MLVTWILKTAVILIIIVCKFNSNGGFLTKWGGNGQFIIPMRIAIDSTGKVYVADQVHQLIKKFTNDGTFITSWSSAVNPTDIAIDSIANSFNNGPYFYHYPC
jgi:DNA-binding beta-propeller fold protein YncE